MKLPETMTETDNDKPDTDTTSKTDVKTDSETEHTICTDKWFKRRVRRALAEQLVTPTR